MSATVLRLPLVRAWCSDCGDMAWFDQRGVCLAADRHLGTCPGCPRPTNGSRPCGSCSDHGGNAG